jgi:two-component system, cell cycle response regulator
MTPESPMKVLIADDERTSRMILKKHLEKAGYEVVAAEDGETARSILLNDPDIAMLINDWIMPGMDGIALCREARAMRRERFLPIMMLTARNQRSDFVDALTAGADAFISKPVDAAELRAQLRVMIRILDLEGRLAAQIDKLEQANATIRKMAETDELTGMPNRRSVLAHLDREVRRAARYGTPVSIVLLDLDHFKQVNDTHGHQAGDAVLIRIAGALARNSRDTDFFGRHGGEEFLGVLSQTTLEGARLTAERIRLAVESEPIPWEGGEPLNVTASLGVAAWNGDGDSEIELVARADQALYHAKDAGRNRVEFAGA